jgi:nitrogen fixation protein FixH
MKKNNQDTNFIRKKNSKIPYFFVAFFATFILVDLFYIYIAQKSWRGVFTQNSYQKGLHYNETLKLASKQQELGWKVDVKYQNLGNLLGEILIKLQDKNGVKIEDAKIIVKFRRPVEEGFDFRQELVFDSGIYQGKIQFPKKGQWDFEIIAIKKEEVLQEVKRYIVR